MPLTRLEIRKGAPSSSAPRPSRWDPSSSSACIGLATVPSSTGSAGRFGVAVSGGLCRLGFTTRRMIMPTTMSRSRNMILRLVYFFWYPVACCAMSERGLFYCVVINIPQQALFPLLSRLRPSFRHYSLFDRASSLDR